jgi:hypothetical protein
MRGKVNNQIAISFAAEITSFRPWANYQLILVQISLFANVYYHLLCECVCVRMR